MATNNRPLKSYIRYDGSGRAVSSSLIWRKNKPKVGNWKEVQGYECCNPVSGLSNTIVTTTLQYPEINFLSFTLEGCFGRANISILAQTPDNILLSGQALADFLNEQLGYLGNFTYTAPDQMSLQLISNLILLPGCTDPSAWTMTILNLA
jgi:hypothetical protein